MHDYSRGRVWLPRRGVRCLETLLSGGVEVPLVVTVRDDPGETQWFGSVTATAAEYGIETVTPADPNTPELQKRLAALQPDFIFSFYYRSLLGGPLLDCARLGALNIHGSLLPRYRGRAPVNWAILRGEQETGATLHYMVDRADAGDIVDQLAIPILENDDARAVFTKVTVAAEIILARSLPGLIAGTAPRHRQPVEEGQYFAAGAPKMGGSTGAGLPARFITWCAPWRPVSGGLCRSRRSTLVHPEDASCSADDSPERSCESGQRRWAVLRRVL